MIPTPDKSEPVWLSEARRYLGQVEMRGPRNNPIIVAMGRKLGLPTFQDSEPWCTLFVAFCLKNTLPNVELPTHLMWSRAFQKWGSPLTKPRLGAIMVYWRGKSIDEDLGHVGFYLGPGLTPGYSRLINGNMSDSVRIADMPDNKLVPDGIRWPIEGRA